jgi:DNA-binding transcriptional regulator GbsR (MarR family)
MFRVIARERKKREIDPTVQMLRQSIGEMNKQKAADPYTRDRLVDLLNFFELANSAYAQMEALPKPALLKLAKLGDKALKLLGISQK